MQVHPDSDVMSPSETKNESDHPETVVEREAQSGRPDIYQNIGTSDLQQYGGRCYPESPASHTSDKSNDRDASSDFSGDDEIKLGEYDDQHGYSPKLKGWYITF